MLPSRVDDRARCAQVISLHVVQLLGHNADWQIIEPNVFVVCSTAIPEPRAYGMQHFHIDLSPTVTISTDERAFFVAFGERLAQQRKTQGLTQVQLAEALAVSQQAITAYESGQRRVPISLLPRLARTLGATVEELIGMPPARSTGKRSTGKRGPAPKIQQQLQQTKPCPRPSSAPSRSCSTPCWVKVVADGP